MQLKSSVAAKPSKGIGRALAERFDEEECEVAVTYQRSEKASEEPVNNIESVDGSGITARARVTNLDRIERVHDALGPTSTLVNSVVLTQDVRFTEMSFMRNETSSSTAPHDEVRRDG